MAVFEDDESGTIRSDGVRRAIYLKITCLFLLITVYFRITGCITQIGANDEWCGCSFMVIRMPTVRAKAVSPLRSRLRFASARHVATAVQDDAGCWMQL